MKASNLILGGVVVGGLYLWWRGNNLVTGINVTINGVDFTNLQRPVAQVNVFNPTKVTVTPDAIKATVLFNNNPIGTINYINKTPIAPMGNTVLNVPIQLSDIGLTTAAVALVEQSTPTGVITVQGYIYVAGVAFAFVQTLKMW